MKCLAAVLVLSILAGCGGTTTNPTGSGGASGSGGGSGAAKSQESACHFNADCKSPLVCAPDGQCRNECAGDRDCIHGETCTRGVCTVVGPPDAATTVPPTGPSKCVLNSDCGSALICAYGLCHAECVTSKDCPAGQRCILSADSTTAVCQLPIEAACHFKSDCGLPLTCAPDLLCRDQCLATHDCLAGQLCVSGVCAEPNDVDASGQLKGARDGG